MSNATSRDRLGIHGITGKPGEPILIAPVLDKLDEYKQEIEALRAALAAHEARVQRERADERAKVIEELRESAKFCDICKMEASALHTPESLKAGGER